MVPFKPLNYSIILGMNAIMQLGGVHISPDTTVNFGTKGTKGVVRDHYLCENLLCGMGTELSNGAMESEMRIDEPDESTKTWRVKWRWADGGQGPQINNTVAQYRVRKEIQSALDQEIEKWVDKEYLIPYNEEELGPPKALIPIFPIFQEHKSKLRPILDFRMVNDSVSPHTAKADVCAVKIRSWRRMGVNTCILDLSSAYHQVFVDKSLWPFQTVKYKGG